MKWLLKILEPLNILTKQLQGEKLTIPDFHKNWLCAELSLTAIINETQSKQAMSIKQLMKGRKAKIYENPLIIAGVYLDPRFRLSLSESEQLAAKKVIRSIFSKMAGNVQVVIEEQVSSGPEDDEMNGIDKYVNDLISKQSTSSTVNNN